MKCYNHSTKDAFSFCFNCGNWYCNDCLAKRMPTPLCKNCILLNDKKTKYNINQIISFKNINFHLILRIISLASLSIWILLGIILHPFYYLLSFFNIFVFVISFFQKKGKKKKLNNNYKKITNAQVYTLLKKYNKITYKKLASATYSTEVASKKKLNQMVLDNILDINSENIELIYTRKE